MKIQTCLLSILLIVSCGKKEDQTNSQNSSSDLNNSEFSNIIGIFNADYKNITADKFGYRLNCTQNIDSVECSDSQFHKLILTNKTGYIARYNVEMLIDSCPYYKDTLPLCKNDLSDLNKKCYMPYKNRCIINGYSIGNWGTIVDKHGDIKLILKFPEDSNEMRTYSKEN